jgi:serine/threonine protein kinase
VEVTGTFSEVMQASDRRIDEAPPNVTRLTTLADFVFIKKISSGAYAQVFLVRKTHTGDTFAMKVIPIDRLQKSSELKRVLCEKDILLQFDNPFIVNFCILSSLQH